MTEFLKHNKIDYKIFFNQIPEALFLHDMNGKIIEVNKNTIEKYGYKKEELLEMKACDIDPDYFNREEKGIFWKKIDKKKMMNFEARHQKKDGTIFPVSINISKININGREYIIALAHDKSNIEKTKKELNEKNRHLKKIFDFSETLICIADLKKVQFIMINPAFEKILGYAPEEITGKSFMEFIHPEDKEATFKVVKQKLLEGQNVLKFINRYRCKDGTYKYLDWESHPIKNEGVTYALARDISKEIEARKKLQESENNYRTIISNVKDIIFRYDAAGKINFVSDNVEQYGFSAREVVGKNMLDFVHPDDKERILKTFKETLKTGKTHPTKFKLLLKNKTFIIAEEISQPLYENKKIKGIVGIIRNINKQAEAEAKLKSRLRELEKFNKAAIDREMKMIELKKRIKELEKNKK